MAADREHNPADPVTEELFINRLTDLSHLTGVIVAGAVLTHTEAIAGGTWGYRRDPNSGKIEWTDLLK
jgi:hypothetical protein